MTRHNSLSLENQARQLLGTLPDRWGRMDMMSKAAIINIGRLLNDAGMLGEEGPILKNGWTGGLIVGSRKGSQAADMHYAETVRQGPGMASPHLFGYTLPNIPLAEAAIQYKLTGPVFVLISNQPFEDAVCEARQWLNELPDEKSIMIAGVLDVIPSVPEPEVTAKFQLIQ